MRRLLAWLGRFRNDGSGALVAEFALTLPMMLILVMGGAEVGRFMLLNQKMDRAATSMADLAAQEEAMTVATLNGLFAAVSPTMTPFTLGGNAVMIVSSIRLVGSTPIISWQRTGAGTLTKASKIGTQGGVATLPSGLTVKTSETIIVAELYYNFTTLFVPNAYTIGAIENQTLYHRAFFRPRIGALDTIS
ncbi:MAG: TadE/TadG family type IV pilus assembly protein [Rhodospirillales bacterium]